MSDSDEPQVPAQEIPQWRSNPPPGLRQYLERQRRGIPGVYESAQRAAQEAQRDDAPAVPVVNAMEEVLGDMERVLEDETSWQSDILPRGHIIEGGFQTRHAVIARLKVLCHEQGFRVGCYVCGNEAKGFGCKSLRLQCTCGRPKKKSDQGQRHFNSRHSCLGCKWIRCIIPFERGSDTPVVIDETSGVPKPVYSQCKWMISTHASSLHCDDHTGHFQVPPNHLPGITTSTVQSIIAEHGMLDSISALQDRLLKKTGQYFSWRRLRHMVMKKTDSLGVNIPRTKSPGKSQELMDWLAAQQASGALTFTSLTMDLDELDTDPVAEQPRVVIQDPPEPAQPPGIMEGLLSRIRNMWRTPPQQPIAGQWLRFYFLWLLHFFFGSDVHIRMSAKIFFYCGCYIFFLEVMFTYD